MHETVAILGASPDPGRYSHMAIQALLTAGHTPVPINPKYNDIDSITCFPDLKSYPDPVDTVTIYLRPSNLQPLFQQIVDLSPRRVIFNPGSEILDIERKLQKAGIEVLRACTLVMLSTNNF